jgi:hypothetical protein
MRKEKYAGGSKVATFRLPLEGFSSARVRVNELLDQIASEMSLERQNDVSPTTKQSKTTLEPKVVNQDISVIAFSCGCTLEGVLFRRDNSCKVLRSKHQE